MSIGALLSAALLVGPVYAAAVTPSEVIAADDRLTANYPLAATMYDSKEATHAIATLLDPEAWADEELDKLLGMTAQQAYAGDAFQPRLHAFDPGAVVFLVYQADLDAISAESPVLSERISDVRRHFSFGPDLPLTAYGIGFAHSKKRPIGAASGGSFNLEQIFRPISLVLMGAVLLAPGLLALAIMRRRRHG